MRVGLGVLLGVQAPRVLRLFVLLFRFARTRRGGKERPGDIPTSSLGKYGVSQDGDPPKMADVLPADPLFGFQGKPRGTPPFQRVRILKKTYSYILCHGRRKPWVCAVFG